MLVAVLLLAGCASGALLSDISKATFLGRSSPNAVDLNSVQLRSDYMYLRVELSGQPPSLLVLGYVDPHPMGNVEVWYSAQGEVLRLQHGRLIGAAGLAVSWKRVAYPKAPPAWTDILTTRASFERVRDVAPGYHHNLVDKVTLTPVSAKNVLGFVSPFQQENSQPVAWFRESYVSSAFAPALPDSWFALGLYQGQQSIVYSRQCLSAELCLSIQRWPLEKVSP